MDAISHTWHSAMAAMENAHPALLFLALALLPLVGVPASPLIMAAGVRLGTGAGFVLVVAALLCDFSLGYWLARRWMRAPLTRWLVGRGHVVPVLAPAEEAQFILLFRITPGIPLSVQNYVLGLAGVDFTLYLLISLPVQAVYALAFVWFGNSLADNAAWKLALGAALLVAIGLAVGLLRRWLKAPSATVQRPTR
jgi:uncharacterized membrane protein YdjX (TVP38/TMEM64 family)